MISVTATRNGSSYGSSNLEILKGLVAALLCFSPLFVYFCTSRMRFVEENLRSFKEYLDENKKLILAIMDNQNLGKLAECAQYQAQLQKNLMYLAAIADAQPQTTPSPLMPPPTTPRNAMQQGALYTPHPQAVAMSQQPVAFAQRAPFSIPHPMQDPWNQLPQQLHPQSTQGLMAVWPVGAANGMNPMHNNVSLGEINSILPTLNPANKQDKPESGATPKSDGQGGSTIAHGADGDKAK